MIAITLGLKKTRIYGSPMELPVVPRFSMSYEEDGLGGLLIDHRRFAPFGSTFFR